jgi:hypothetical protein
MLSFLISGWRRRSYDPDVDYNVASRRVPTSSVTSSFGRPLTDLTSVTSSTSFGRPMTDLSGGVTAGVTVTPASLALARSRSRSRVSASELESPYMRYVAPSTVVNPSSLISGMRPGAGSSGLTSRPMSSGYLYGHAPATYGGYHYMSSAGEMPPHAPPGYNAREREVSARIRRYQQQPPPES